MKTENIDNVQICWQIFVKIGDNKRSSTWKMYMLQTRQLSLLVKALFFHTGRENP